MIGQEIGGYRVVRKIGEGGMGAVYEAQHLLIGRRAALKVLLPEWSHKQEIVSRFFNEAKASTAIRHPGIVEIFDFGYHHDGSAFIVMEYLDGESLETRIRRLGRLAAPDAVNICKQVVGALAAAHAMGIVHRDLKPDNIFLVPDPDVVGGERAKLLDFGIAKLADEQNVASVKTRTGSVMGTPTYMSPEQCKGAGAVDHRSDLYSMACILFQLVIGRPPFVAEGAGELLAQHIYQPPPTLWSIDASLPEALNNLVAQLLAKDPAHRVQTANDVVAALNHIRGASNASLTPTAIAPQGYGAPGYATGPGYGASSQTTLGAAAGAAGTRPPTVVGSGGKRFIVPIALGAAIAIGGVAFAMTRGGGGDAEPQAAVQPAPAPEPEPEPTPEPTPPVVEQPAAKITIAINSQPADASVYRQPAGVRIGRTPSSQSLEPMQGELVYLVKKSGYKDATVVARADESGTYDVTLEKIERRRRTPDPKKPRDPPGEINPFDKKPKGGSVNPFDK